MENFIINTELNFKDEHLNDLIDSLNKCFLDKQKNFADLGYMIFKIASYTNSRFFETKSNLYYNVNTLLAKFGFDKKAVSRYKNSFERFCLLDSKDIPYIKPLFNKFTASKLFEMLPLDDEILVKAIDSKEITCNMTVKDIRKKIKLLLYGDKEEEKKVEEIKEEEIPAAYEPSKEYDFEYFKSKTKSQLLNMIWDLQKAFQKLKVSQR